VGFDGLINLDARLIWLALERRVIYTEDELDLINASLFFRTLDYLVAQSDEPIKVYITSGGGIVQAGLGMYDAIMKVREKGIEVDTYIVGMAASMAVIVAQAGMHRYATESSRLLVHELSELRMFSEDKPSELKERLHELERLQDVLLNILSKHTQRAKEEIADYIFKKDVWFTAEEAKEFGLIDEII